jgi:hypothetical protein
MDEKGPVPVHFRQTASQWVPGCIPGSGTEDPAVRHPSMVFNVCGSGSTFQSLISALSVLGILMLLVKPKR